MNELSEAVQKELAERVEGKLTGFHIIAMLKMMLSNRTNDKEAAREEGKEHARELEAEAKEATAEIISLITQTLQTGALPDKKKAA